MMLVFSLKLIIVVLILNFLRTNIFVYIVLIFTFLSRSASICFSIHTYMLITATFIWDDLQSPPCPILRHLQNLSRDCVLFLVKLSLKENLKNMSSALKIFFHPLFLSLILTKQTSPLKGVSYINLKVWATRLLGALSPKSQGTLPLTVSTRNHVHPALRS